MHFIFINLSFLTLISAQYDNNYYGNQNNQSPADQTNSGDGSLTSSARPNKYAVGQPDDQPFYKPIKSCFYCMESAIGYCTATEVKEIRKSCPGFLPEKCAKEDNIKHENVTHIGVSQVTAHLGRARTQLQCDDITIAGCDQVDRGEDSKSRLFLCCSSCKPAAGYSIGNSSENLQLNSALFCLVLSFYFLF